MPEEIKRIALFIDFDNGQLNITYILEALRERGVLLMKRAYGDWERFSRFKNTLAEHGVELIERPPIHSADKNGADITLAVDAMEACLINEHADVFAIVSGDSDFLPLISRLQAHNKRVIVIAKRANASTAVVRNCNEYIAYENLLPQKGRPARGGARRPERPAAASSAAPAATTAPPADATGEGTEGVPWDGGDLDLAGALSLLQRAVTILEDESGEARSSVVKQKMIQLFPAFSEKDYGCAQFRDFLAEAQKRKAIRLGRKVEGSYLITVGEGEADTAPGEPAEPRAPSAAAAPVAAAPAEAPRLEAPRPEAAPDASPTTIADSAGVLAPLAARLKEGEETVLDAFGSFYFEDMRDDVKRLRFKPAPALVDYLNGDLTPDGFRTHLEEARSGAAQAEESGSLFGRIMGKIMGNGGELGDVQFLVTTARTLKGTGAVRWEGLGVFRTQPSTRKPARPDGTRPMYTKFYPSEAFGGGDE